MLILEKALKDIFVVVQVFARMISFSNKLSKWFTSTMN